MIKKKKIAEASIPTASMADIAFLLLLFFLVSTVIDVDTGLGLALPEYVDDPEIVKVDPERMASVLVNENGDVLIDGQFVALHQIKANLKPRITSKIDLPGTKKLIVSLKTDRKTSYVAYISALDQIKLAYHEIWDEHSNSRFGNNYDKLKQEQQKQVREAVPIIISLAEPESITK